MHLSEHASIMTFQRSEDNQYSSQPVSDISPRGEDGQGQHTVKI